MTLWSRGLARSRDKLKLLYLHYQCLWPPYFLEWWLTLKGSHPCYSKLKSCGLTRSRDKLKSIISPPLPTLWPTNLARWWLTVRGCHSYTFKQVGLWGNVTNQIHHYKTYRVSPSERGLGGFTNYPKIGLSLPLFCPQNFDFVIFKQFLAILSKFSPPTSRPHLRNSDLSAPNCAKWWLIMTVSTIKVKWPFDHETNVLPLGIISPGY